MNRSSPEYLELVKEGATQFTLDRILPVADAMMGEDGEVFGDTQLQGADFVAWFVDKQRRNIIGNIERLQEHMPPNAPLKNYAQTLRDEYDRQYRRLLMTDRDAALAIAEAENIFQENRLRAMVNTV